MYTDKNQSSLCTCFELTITIVTIEVTEDEAAAALREAAAEDGSGNIDGQKLVAAALRRLVVS